MLHELASNSTQRALAERLVPRVAIEERAARTGKSFRRKPLMKKCDRLFIKPALRLALKTARLYEQGYRNALDVVVRDFTLEVSNLPRELNGLQVMHLSDLHIDGTDGLSEVVCRKLAGLWPDLCLLTGDYRFETFGPCDETIARMKPIIKSISARHGILGIMGNHDPSEMAYALEDMGVRMLVNEAAEIQIGHASAWVVGVDDPYDYRCDNLEAAMSSVPADAFKILLAHSPELYADAVSHGADLYLCGHTHAGQIRLPVIGPLTSNSSCPKAYAQGHWRHRNMHGITSAGIGCSMLPVRFNCPPEIIMINLVSES